MKYTVINKDKSLKSFYFVIIFYQENRNQQGQIMKDIVMDNIIESI